MKKFILYILILGMLALTSVYTLSSKGNVDSSSKIEGWNCLDTFDDFLYQMTEISRSDPRYKMSGIYPSEPWEFVQELPESYTLIGLYISSFIPSTEKIFSTSPYPSDNGGTVHEDVVVKDIFEMADGSIIGTNYPKSHDTVWPEAIPLFSIYNELNGKFEFFDIGLSYPADSIRFDWVGMIPRDGVIVANDRNTIWIYQQQDGLFSYDSVNSVLYHHEISFTGIVQRMVISPDGNILFSQEREGSDWELTPGELLIYNPVSQTVKEINVPFVRWPDYGTLLYTDSGDLWIGIHGYLSIDGSWILKNPRPQAFKELGMTSERYNWASPNLIFQSSNGYLWYTSYSGDFLGVNGSAWYDPATDSGCWFTTESGFIVEDTQQTLWMITDRKLYKYELAE